MGDSKLEAQLTEIATSHTGRLGVVARDLGSGHEVLLNADEVFPTASVIKLPLLVELMRQADHGTVSLKERVELREADLRGGSGILKVLEPGLAPTLRDVATLMIVLSDNTATNLIIDAVGGVEAVNRTMDQLGLSTIKLHNRVDFQVVGDDVRRLGESSPRDMCALVEGIARRTLISPQVSEGVEKVLAGQQYLDQVPRYMTVMPYAAEFGLVPEVSVANKTGFFTGTRADAGIIRYRNGGGFAYAVFNHESADETFLPEAEGSVVAGLVGRAILVGWWPGGHASAPVAATPYQSL
jgi:beta-lactamase class A